MAIGRGAKRIQDAMGITDAGLAVVSQTDFPIYIKSPNGHYWELTITDLGILVGVDRGTDAPVGGIISDNV